MTGKEILICVTAGVLTSVALEAWELWWDAPKMKPADDRPAILAHQEEIENAEKELFENSTKLYPVQPQWPAGTQLKEAK